MQEFILNFLQEYEILAPAIFIAIRALAIIVPPISGAIVDIAGIAAFGWVKSFILAEAGVMLGGIVAFFIGRKFREPAIARFASLKRIEMWEEKLSDNNKFWGLVFLRLLTNSLFDYISYAAGLSKIKFWKFFVASFIGNVPGLFIFYYFGGLLYSNSIYYALVFLSGVLVLGAVIAKGDKLLNILTGGIITDKHSHHNDNEQETTSSKKEKE